MAYDPRGFLRGSIGFVGRSTVLHVLTYFVIGAASYWLVARRYWTGPEALPWLRDPEGDFVPRWFMPAQVVRRTLRRSSLPAAQGTPRDGRLGWASNCVSPSVDRANRRNLRCHRGLGVYDDLPRRALLRTLARGRHPGASVRLPPACLGASKSEGLDLRASRIDVRTARRTPRISCEAVSASDLAGAGMSRHLRPRNGAGESFVSFIRLLGGAARASCLAARRWKASPELLHDAAVSG